MNEELKELAKLYYQLVIKEKKLLSDPDVIIISDRYQDIVSKIEIPENWRDIIEV